MHIKKQNGFTLTELVVTVALLAVITSVAIPSYTGYIKGARMTEAKNNIASLKLAEEEFFLENNAYFYDESNDNDALNTASGGLWTASPGDNGVNFTYTVSGAGLSYSITATGNNGTPVAGETESYDKN